MSGQAHFIVILVVVLLIGAAGILTGRHSRRWARTTDIDLIDGSYIVRRGKLEWRSRTGMTWTNEKGERLNYDLELILEGRLSGRTAHDDLLKKL